MTFPCYWFCKCNFHFFFVWWFANLRPPKTEFVADFCIILLPTIYTDVFLNLTFNSLISVDFPFWPVAYLQSKIRPNDISGANVWSFMGHMMYLSPVGLWDYEFKHVLWVFSFSEGISLHKFRLLTWSVINCNPNKHWLCYKIWSYGIWPSKNSQFMFPRHQSRTTSVKE